jgi:hypothetical protein
MADNKTQFVNERQGRGDIERWKGVYAERGRDSKRIAGIVIK